MKRLSEVGIGAISPFLTLEVRGRRIRIWVILPDSLLTLAARLSGVGAVAAAAAELNVKASRRSCSETLPRRQAAPRTHITEIKTH